MLRLPVTHRLSNPRLSLYGGTGVSAATVVAEALTGRSLTWISVQFVGNTSPGEVLEFRARVVAGGARTSQVQVRATVGDRLVLTALSAHSAKECDDAEGFATPPYMPPPDECELFVLSVELESESFVDTLERRVVPFTADSGRDGHVGMWVRVPTWPGPSSARLGYVADVVPVAVFLAGRRNPGAISLDNTVRVIDPELGDAEWMLFDIEADGISRSTGHGRARIWSVDGRLLAVGSQSCIMRPFASDFR